MLGTAFRVRSTDPSVGRALARLLMPFATRRAVPGFFTFSLVGPDPSGDGRHRLYRNCTAILRANGWRRIVDHLLATLNTEAVADFDPFAVHAGVVTLGERAFAFPADSGVGKTTLAAACLLEGFAYASDEALCVSYDDALVSPYPKPLGLSAWARRQLGLPDPDLPWPTGDHEAPYAPDELGPVSQPPLRLAGILLLEPGARGPALERLERSDGAAALLRMSFNHHKNPAGAFRLSAELARAAEVWRLRLGPPHPSASLLRRAVG